MPAHVCLLHPFSRLMGRPPRPFDVFLFALTAAISAALIGSVAVRDRFGLNGDSLDALAAWARSVSAHTRLSVSLRLSLRAVLASQCCIE
jgi:hypothetical protein